MLITLIVPSAFNTLDISGAFDVTGFLGHCTTSAKAPTAQICHCIFTETKMIPHCFAIVVSHRGIGKPKNPRRKWQHTSEKEEHRPDKDDDEEQHPERDTWNSVGDGFGPDIARATPRKETRLPIFKASAKSIGEVYNFSSSSWIPDIHLLDWYGHLGSLIKVSLLLLIIHRLLWLLNMLLVVSHLVVVYRLHAQAAHVDFRGRKLVLVVGVGVVCVVVVVVGCRSTREGHPSLSNVLK